MKEIEDHSVDISLYQNNKVQPMMNQSIAAKNIMQSIDEGEEEKKNVIDFITRDSGEKNMKFNEKKATEKEIDDPDGLMITLDFYKSGTRRPVTSDLQEQQEKSSNLILFISLIEIIENWMKSNNLRTSANLKVNPFSSRYLALNLSGNLGQTHKNDKVSLNKFKMTHLDL